MGCAKTVWPPYPYRAGFTITDDTDAATLESVRTVYDFLVKLGLRTTKTVWPFSPTEPCGIPPTPVSTLREVTLEEQEYLTYCKTLHDSGFEIALHGASAGNNLRQRTADAFALMEEMFGGSPTYICHSKNADNIYWEAGVAPTPSLTKLLSLYTKHQCFGESEGSPYFWGDICLEKVRQIRLFRTRNTNTLAANPSMPYFRAETPYVAGWFSATKRSFADCTSEAALNSLATDFGLTVLYQYLHRYADPDSGNLSDTFRENAIRLAQKKSDIWVATTSAVMDRLRALQGIFIVFRHRRAWIVNTNDSAAKDLQIILPPGVTCQTSPGQIEQTQNRVHLATLPAGSITEINFNTHVCWEGPRAAKLNKNGSAVINFGHGSVSIDVGDAKKHATFDLKFADGLSEGRKMSKAPQSELLRLFFGQSGIIAREFLFKGRKMDTESYLSGDEIPLENHDNW